MNLYEIFQRHPRITTDSRNCPPDSIFFALKGENFDANAFALAALEKGCAYAVVDDPQYCIDERFILVENVLRSLQELARFHRQQLGTTLIGITGTNGKTTTKELIAAVLKQKYNTLFTQGNLNNHIGVPLTLLQLTNEHEMAIVEMGANHPGEIRQLAEIALPDYGIITNVGKAHLEGFGSFEGVMKTKAELYDFIHEHDGQIFLNTGNDFLKGMAVKSGFTSKEGVVSYQMNDELHNHLATGRILSCNPLLKMACRTSKGAFEVHTKLIGTYNAENVLAAVAIGSFLGVDNQMIRKGLEEYQPQNNRSQFVRTERNSLIVDAYNANPTSMRAAILNFVQMDLPDKMLILGDMLELGEQSDDEHQQIVSLLEENGLEQVLLVGKNFQSTENHFQTFENVDEVDAFLQVHPIESRSILVKGSHGVHLEKILTRL